MTTDTLIKDGLKAAAIGGVKALQKALMVDADGIIGKNTNRALNDIDINVLLSKLTGTVSPPDLSFEALAAEYKDMYEKCTILPEHRNEVTQIVSAIKKNQSRYEYVASFVPSVPTYVIGIIHSLECSLSFNLHLHNGDPLSRRTVNVPAGRPIFGNPPFTWDESAIDALMFSGLDTWTNWSPEGTAYSLEGHINGFGYRKYTNIKSPYLWSFTNLYIKGKYDVDGHFNPSLVSTQCGGMAILKEIMK